MTREEVTNSEGYKVTKAALEWYENNQDLDAIDAFEAGANWMREQMRKDAVVATVTSLPNDWGEYMPIIEIGVDRDYQEGDKVKVLIIKEE